MVVGNRTTLGRISISINSISCIIGFFSYLWSQGRKVKIISIFKSKMILSTLKRFWREIIMVILVIIVAISVQTCQRKVSDAEVLKQIHSDTIRVYKNKQNELVSQVQTHNLTISQLKDEYQQLGIDKKKLESQVGKLNNLVGYWKGKASVTDTFTVVNHDTTLVDNGVTLTAKSFEWHNKNLTIDGLSYYNKTTIKYKYEFNFELVPYRKKSGFLGLGKGTLVTDITFDDPNLKVKEFKGIVIQEPKKQFYQTKVFALGAGFILGAYTTIKLIK